MVSFFLVVVLNGSVLAAPSTGAPIPFESLKECHAVARKANSAERDALKAAGAEYVCLKIERVTI